MKNLKMCLIVLTGLSFGMACKKSDELKGSLETGTSGILGTGTNAILTAGSLIDYKNSSHQLSVGYYRTWRDSVTATGNTTSMRRLPDSLDMVMVFPDYTPPENAYWNVLKTNYVPYLHTKGTKVIITIGDLGAATTTGAQDSAGYALWAKSINDKWILEYNLDGIDIDIESNPTGTTLSKKVAATKALSKYFGPKSGTGKKFIYDTNQNPTNYFIQSYKCFDYTFLQAYGRSTSNLTSTFNLYSTYITPNKFLPGFSFYEENGSNWGDVTFPDPTHQSRCYKYASWQPAQGTKGGLFSYAIDRDIPYITNSIVAPDYATTKRLIKLMNP